MLSINNSLLYEVVSKDNYLANRGGQAIIGLVLFLWLF